MANRSESVPLTLSDLESWDARGQIFQADMVNDFRTVDLDRLISATTLLQGTGPHPSPISGVHTHTLHRRTTKFDVVTHVERDMCLGATPTIPREQSSSDLQCWGFSCMHNLLMQDDQIRFGNTYGAGRVLGGQPLIGNHR